MDRDSPEYIRAILGQVKTIAIVGASPKPERPSHSVMGFLLGLGYQCTPVNPGQAGKAILNRTVYATLADIPHAVDMVDIFRRSEEAGRVVDEARALPERPGVIWMQLGVRDEASAARAVAAGLRVVMNRCPAIDIPRLGIRGPASV